MSAPSKRVAESPFVGRLGEQEAIARALPLRHAAAGRFVAISGEPGIGKTRFMDEVARAASMEGCRVLWASMIEDPSAPPYSCWTSALRAYVKDCDDELLARDLGSAASDIADLLPELRDRLPLARGGATTGNGTAARYQLFDAVTRLLLAASSHKPLVLLFDNLHAADPSALALLEHFCGQIRGSRVLVVGAYRRAEFDRRNSLRTTLARLARTPGFMPLPLGGLLANEVADLLHLRLGAAPPPSLVQSLLAQSGGNPLFVSEVAGLLARELDAHGFAPTRYRFRVPESLEDVIVARLDALPNGTRSLLRVAAVLGREFTVALLADLAGNPSGYVRRALQAAETAGITVETEPDRLGFSHVLFREVLYAEHGTLASVRLHRRAAELLEARKASHVDSSVPLLAHHYFEAARAGAEQKAVEYCVLAAELSTRQRAYGEAVAMYERAVQAAELAAEPDVGQRFALLLAMGRSQYQAGELNSATQTLMRAAILAYRNRWWERLAEALFSYQLVGQQSGFRHVASVPLHLEVLEHIPADAKALRARVLASLGKAYRTAGEPQLAASSFRRGAALARESGDRSALLDCLRKGNWTAGREPDSIRAGLETAREAFEVAKELRHTEAMLDSLTDIVFQLCDLGEIAEVERTLAELRRLAHDERQPHFQNVLAGFETAIEILRGRWQKALYLTHEAARQIPLVGVFGLQGRYAFQLFAITRAQGGLADLRPIAERVLATMEAGELWLPGQIILLTELGQSSRAKEALGRLGDLSALPKDDLYLVALVYLADACIKLRSARHCAELFELLGPYRSLNATLPGTLMLGAVAGHLASLALTLRRFEDAILLFEEALAMNAAMGAGPALAWVQAEYARLLILHGPKSAHERARALLAEAQATAEHLGLHPVLDAIRELRAGTGVETLTHRETEVLRAVAKGLSNGRIATALHISHSTVATHIRRIFAKTGVSNRTEAAEFARRASLLDRE